jgi:hypothetical protein
VSSLVRIFGIPFCGILVFMFFISKEHRREFSLMRIFCISFIKLIVFFTLCGFGSCMISLSNILLKQYISVCV